MWVVATAGHVDHGKSTLVRALTGMEPDRWAEERRRGMTIDLGFAWTTLPSGATVAFVDVPGHERFVPNMLAGVGPVPAALIVVAADEGWMPQSAEHLAALHALGVRHGLLAVTRTDLADPGRALRQARAEIAATSLGEVAAVAVSGTTGAGLDELRFALDQLGAALPAPSTSAPVRLWVDRCFVVRGSGTVVTGTLGAGRLRVGDELEIAGSGERVRVRGLQSLGRTCSQVPAVARVALNLRGVAHQRLARGAALLSPGRFHRSDCVDIRLAGDPAADLPAQLTLHVGAAAVGVRVRPLGPDTVRLRLATALPLRVGDRALLRDPGRHRVTGGVTVLDVDPPPLRRRGAAAARAQLLAAMDGSPDFTGELRRRRLVQGARLARMGVPVQGTPLAGDWYVDPAHRDDMRARLAAEVARHQRENPLAAGLPVDTLCRLLGLPDRALLAPLVPAPLVLRDGRVGTPSPLPAGVLRAVERIRQDFAHAPFRAPESDLLTALGLGPREIAAAVRSGLLFRVAENVVLPPDAVEAAARVLAGLPQPFTLSAARRALDTSRRVAVPLLETLDRQGVTRRLPDDSRTLGGP